MKGFKMIAAFLGVGSVLMLSGILVNASSFPSKFYTIKYLSSTYTYYENPATQTTYTVTVNTRPENPSAVVKVEINKNYPATLSGAVAEKTFPGNMNIPGLTFSLPAKKKYYAIISTTYLEYVNGSLTAVY